MPNLTSLIFFIPEFILMGTCLLLLMFALSKRLGRVAPYVAMLGLVVETFFVLAFYSIGTPPLFWGMLVMDRPAAFFKLIFAVSALLVIMFSQASKEISDDTPEYYALITGSVLGMNLLSQANNLLMIYLSLEFVSLLSYLMVGYVKGSKRSSEAALKYVLYGAVASGIFLYGSSLYYGATGSLYLGGLSSFAYHPSPIMMLSGLFILAGFLYKIAAVPMHAWCPDAYEGAPTPITAFLSVAPKAAGFAVLMRVAMELGVNFKWPVVIGIISAVTMTFGNLVAIPQMNVKRLLAYSSIAHAGYLLMGVACFTPKGSEAVYLYFIAYLIMNLGAFLIVEIIANRYGSDSLETFKGLVHKGPYGVVLSIAMAVFLLSLTGVPPFVGFIGKFYIFSSVIDARLYWLALVGIVNSVISLYYYMRIVKAMFFDPATDTAAITVDSRRLSTLAVSLALATIVFGLAWQWLSYLVANVLTN